MPLPIGVVLTVHVGLHMVLAAAAPLLEGFGYLDAKYSAGTMLIHRGA